MAKLIEIAECVDDYQKSHIKRIIGDIGKIHLSLFQYLMLDCKTNYHNKCRITSHFSYEILSDLYPEYDFRLDGGWEKKYVHDEVSNHYCDDSIVGGMYPKDNLYNYKGHYWLKSEELGIIIDFSAMQFGYDEVVITDVCDDRFSSNLNEVEIYDEIKYINKIPGDLEIDKNSSYTPQECFDITMKRLHLIYENVNKNIELDGIKKEWSVVKKSMTENKSKEYSL